MSFFQTDESLYVSNKKELSRVLIWTGVIIFWLTFWLPSGIFLGGNPTHLGIFFPQMEVIIPALTLGIVLVFLAQIITNFKQKLYLKSFWHGAKTTSLWLAIIFIISLFSRDFTTSVLFILIWLMGMLLIPISREFFPDNLSKKGLIVVGVLLGFVVYKYFPELLISSDLLALVSLFGLIFCTEDLYIYARDKRNFILRIMMQIVFLFVIFQSSNFIFPLLALLVLFFLGKILVFGRGKLSPDFWGILIFAGFFITRIYLQGIYTISLPTVIPDFLLNFREILLGVGQGQFLPVLQQSSEHLLPLSELKIPNSSLLLTFFEQGILGVLAIFLLFLFSYYLHPKRSFIYIFLIFILWIFSSVFSASENGIILMILFLFLNTEQKISRDFLS